MLWLKGRAEGMLTIDVSSVPGKIREKSYTVTHCSPYTDSGRLMYTFAKRHSLIWQGF